MIKASLYADQEREAKLNKLGDARRLMEQQADLNDYFVLPHGEVRLVYKHVASRLCSKLAVLSTRSVKKEVFCVQKTDAQRNGAMEI